MVVKPLTALPACLTAPQSAGMHFTSDSDSSLWSSIGNEMTTVSLGSPVLDERCAPLHVGRIAEEIEDWKELAPYFSLTEAEEQTILASHAHQPELYTETQDAVDVSGKEWKQSHLSQNERDFFTG